MKKGILTTIIVILIIGIGYYGLEMFGFAKGVQADTQKLIHNETNKNFILLSEGISPNEKYKYYEYQFDNGGLGYSRTFWSVIENKGIATNLFHGKIPDGYKIKGWTKINELILEKWKPYYHKKDEKIKIISSEFNGIKIKMLE